MTVSLKVKKLTPDAALPVQAKPGDAGYDLVAIDDGVWDAAGVFIQYRTGISIEPPAGYHTELFPRSSISKTDLVLANGIGLVDNGYRGEILLRFKGIVRQMPLNTLPLTKYKKGDKIAQIVIRQTHELPVEEVTELSSTERGTGGFGSSGK